MDTRDIRCFRLVYEAWQHQQSGEPAFYQCAGLKPHHPESGK